MFKQIGPWEIILILVIVLIFFGVGKLPQVGASIGKAIRSFKKAQSGEGDNEEEEKTTTPVNASTEKNSNPKKTTAKKS